MTVATDHTVVVAVMEAHTKGGGDAREGISSFLRFFSLPNPPSCKGAI